jgi:hypothetical protein
MNKVSNTESIALDRMDAEVPEWKRDMVAADVVVRAGDRRGSVHDLPAVLPEADARRVHDAEARAAEERKSRGPSAIGPQDRLRAAPRGF